MKKLELNQMEKLNGGGLYEFLHGATCAASAIGLGVFIAGSAGTGAILVAPLLASSTLGAGCIAMVGKYYNE